MYRTMLKSKIHRAVITEANLHYVGSITIDTDLLEKANIVEHEKVQIVNSITSPAEITVFRTARVRSVCLMGGGRWSSGRFVIIISYARVPENR